MENKTAKRSNVGRSLQAHIAKSVIDCDIHNSVPPGGLSPYLSERWQEYYKTFGLRGTHRRLLPARTPQCRTARRMAPFRDSPPVQI